MLKYLANKSNLSAMFCIAIVRSNRWTSGWDHWWYNRGSYKNTEGFYPTKVPCATPRKAPIYPRNKDIFFKYLSESPKEKSVNRKELCGRLILSWNIIEATYVFLRCFWRSEFALCRACGNIPKTGSTFYLRCTNATRIPTGDGFISDNFDHNNTNYKNKKTKYITTNNWTARQHTRYFSLLHSIDLIWLSLGRQTLRRNTSLDLQPPKH